MKKRMIFILLLLFSFTSLAQAAQEEAPPLLVNGPEKAAKVSYQNMENGKLLVSVTDADEEPIMGLTDMDFSIRQGIKKAKIVSVEPLATDKQVPLNIVLVIDNSYSMTVQSEGLSRLDRARREVTELLGGDSRPTAAELLLTNAAGGAPKLRSDLEEPRNRLTRAKPLIVDSRFRTLLFRGARCMTPNESEAIEAAGIPARGGADIESVGWKLIEETGAESLVITRGNQGMIIFEENGALTRLATFGEDEAVDVTGAGDTVAATLTAALVAGATTLEAAELANCAAGVVVMKTGAATCTTGELRDRIHSRTEGNGFPGE